MGVEGGNKESLRCKEAGETAAAPPQRTTQSSNIPPSSIYNNLETDDASGSHPRGPSFTSFPTIPESFMVFTPRAQRAFAPVQDVDTGPPRWCRFSMLASKLKVTIKLENQTWVSFRSWTRLEKVRSNISSS